MNSKNLIILENIDQWNDLYKSDKKIIIDYSATWCGPCKLLLPVLKLLSDKFPDITFVKIDVDDFEELCMENEISCMPTIHFMHNKEIKHIVEGLDLEKIVNLTENFN